MLTTALAITAATWAVLMAVAPFLQIRAMVREQSSRQVSIGYFAILLVGFTLWFAYGVAADLLALIVPNAVAFLATLATIVVAVRFR